MSGPSRPVTFFKMHSLGNDFLVLDRVTQPVNLSPEQVSAWADRKTGVGFDQLLTIDPPTTADADFDYGIYNADGSKAEQCGNGTRCVTLLAHHLKLTKKSMLYWQSPAGRIRTQFNSATQIETTLTVPQLALVDIPFNESAATAGAELPDAETAEEQHRTWRLDSAAGAFEVTPVSMGNPHGIMFFDNIFDTDIAAIGGALTRHAAFPEGANMGFCQVIDRQFVRLRVFERGVGETRACGSGACAAVVAAHLHGLVNDKVKISLPGGKLRITWPGPGHPVTMSGAATLVYCGELYVGQP